MLGSPLAANTASNTSATSPHTTPPASSAVAAAFGPAIQLPEHAAVLARVSRYCSTFNLTPSQLHAKWEALLLTATPAKHGSSASSTNLTVPSAPQLDELHSRLLAERSSSLATASTPTTTGPSSVSNSPQLRRLSTGKHRPADSLVSPRHLAVKRKLTPATTGYSPQHQSTILGRNSPTATTIATSSSSSSTGATPGSLQARLTNIDTDSSRRFLESRTLRKSQPPMRIDQLNTDKPSQNNNNINESQPHHATAIDLNVVSTPLIEGYRHLSIRPDTVGDFLDSRLNTFSEIILAQICAGNDEDDLIDDADGETTAAANATDGRKPSRSGPVVLSHPGVPSQQEVYAVGRITFNPKEDERISFQNVYLESSRRLGSGSRIQLDLSQLKNTLNLSFSLFAGQIVGVRGNNPTGKLFIVKEFIYPDVPEPSYLVHEDRRPMLTEKQTGITKLFLASGPYTFNDNINYEPLNVLVNDVILAEGSGITACIFSGPFVDENNQYIATICDATPEEIFRYKVAPYFNKLIDRGISVVLVSALSDMITPYMSLPQPPLVFGRNKQDQTERRQLLRLKSSVQYITNPAIVQINGATIAFCNSDSIVDIMSNEISSRGDMDRLSAPFVQLLQQRSFTPVFPSQNDLPDAPLCEFTMMQHMALDVVPDILISVSSMKPCVREVFRSVCINPGHSVRGKSAGSYAIIQFNNVTDKSVKMESSSDNGDQPSDQNDVQRVGVLDTCEVEIFNL